MPRPLLSEQVTPLYRGIISGMYPLLQAGTRRHWTGLDNVPRHGGFVAVANHISMIDHFPIGHFLVAAGRAPHFLAKSSLFTKPLVRQVLSGTDQIPVERNTGRAASALRAAIDAVEEGACVFVYPEGTVTKDPDALQQHAKTGAARIAIEASCPLVPIAIWGTRAIWEPYAGQRLPHPPRRHVIQITACPPLLPPVGLATDAARHDAALDMTTEAMEQIARQVARMRAEEWAR